MRPASNAHDVAVRKHCFKTQHVITCYPILKATWPSSISGDVPADEAFSAACRIRRIVQTQFLDSSLESFRDHPWLNYGHKILRTDLLDSIHFGQGEHHSPLDWHTAAHIAMTGTA